MKNILITVSALDFGGVELRTLETIKHITLNGLKCNIYVYVISGRKGILDDRVVEAGATIIYAPKGKIKRYMALAATLAKKKIDVIHVNASYASGLINAIAFVKGVKVRISHIRSASFPEMKKWKKIKYIIYLPMLTIFSTKVIGVTAYARKVARVPKKKWQTVYDGVTTPSYFNNPSQEKDSLSICVMGRMHPCKNLPMAAKIVSRLPNYYSGEISVNFIGTEDLHIKNQVIEVFQKNNYKNYTFWGGLDHSLAMSKLSSADVLLLTSIREGLPGVCIEAVALGVPVVSAKLPGVMELQQHLKGITALNLNDSLQYWCDAILSYRNNHDRSARKELIDSFGVSPFTIERHVQVLSSVWGL